MSDPGKPQRPTLRGNLRSLPRGAWFLAAGSFLNRFGSFVFSFLLLYLRHLGYSPSQAGLVLSMYGIGGVAAAAVGGWMADRLGRRTAIVVSMTASAAVMLALRQVHSLGAIMPLTFGAGLAAESYRPASAALITDLVPERARVTAFGVYRLSINAGFAVGPIVGGLLAERSFGLLFLGDALTSLLFAAVALFLLPQGRRSKRGQERRGEGFRAVAGDRTFLLICGATVLTAFVYSQMFSTFPLHVRASGFSPQVYGALVSINGALIVLAELPLTSLTMRLPARWVIAVGYVLTGLGFAAMGLVSTVPLLAVTVVVWTVGEMVESPVAATFVAGLAPDHLRGRYQGVFTSMFGIAFILGPAVGSALFQAAPAVLWTACAVLPCVAAAMVLSTPRRRAQAAEKRAAAVASEMAVATDPPTGEV